MVNFPRLLRAASLVSLAALLGGCVAGQTIGLDYTPEEAPSPAKNVTVSVEVKDNRPDVVQKSKPATYIGTYRGGFGNTFNVNTGSGEPFADIVKRDLSADLKSLGFKATDGAAARKVQVTINEWKFDAYMNGTYWHDVTVSILDGQNRTLKSHTLKNSVNVEGSAMTGAKYAMEREVPKLYRGVIRKMVRENTDALKALQK